MSNVVDLGFKGPVSNPSPATVIPLDSHALWAAEQARDEQRIALQRAAMERRLADARPATSETPRVLTPVAYVPSVEMAERTDDQRDLVAVKGIGLCRLILRLGRHSLVRTAVGTGWLMSDQVPATPREREARAGAKAGA